MATNPFFEIWDTPFSVPPFAAIRPEHFRPAYEKGFAEHAAEIVRIASNPDAPSFENTIVALETSGRMLSRIDQVFFNLASSDTNDELQAIERDLAPLRLEDVVEHRRHEHEPLVRGRQGAVPRQPAVLEVGAGLLEHRLVGPRTVGVLDPGEPAVGCHGGNVAGAPDRAVRGPV